MSETNIHSKKRIQLVDALRGFALLGIVLIHFIEHFELFKQPEFNYFFSPETNRIVFETIFFLISGKAYSIFAIMFGFSFFIQLNRKEQNGIDFRLTFAWRLILLLIMGLIHSMVYRGDILHIYALLGLFLILFYKVSTKLLLLSAFLFAVQTPIIYHFIQSFIVSDFTYVKDWGGNYGANCTEAYAYGSLWDVMKVNFWEARYIVWAWTYYTGRFVQLFALFLIGLFLGRIDFFNNPKQFLPAIKKVLVICILSVVSIHFILKGIESSTFSGTQKMLLNDLLKSYVNLGYTAIILAVFSLFCIKVTKSFFIDSLAVYGRMSLSNYVFQALFGVVFFYGFGFGMFNYMGATWSLIAGIGFFIFQVAISSYWLKRYYYGPLEWLWRAFTFIDFKLKFKRQKINYNEIH